MDEDYQKRLEKNEKAKELGDTIQVCTRQPQNLQALVGGYKHEASVPTEVPPDAVCVKCGKCRVVCPVLNEGNTFKSTATGKAYNIRQKTTCFSDWVIYLITCKKCKKYKGQYVGKSQTVLN